MQPSVALDATWRLIRETNAYLEANEPWKADPGPEVDAVMGDALEALRIVAVLATPGHPRHVRRDLAPHRPGRLARPTQRLPGGGRVGRLPGRARRSRRATSLFPRIKPSLSPMAVALDRQPLPPAGRRRRRPT